MNTRDSRIDIIRLVALFSLIVVHFILRMDLYQCEVEGPKWLLVCIVRSFGMCCIPLFLLLTGYLTGDKAFSNGYYKKLIRVLIIYLLASLITCIFDFWRNGIYINAKGFGLKVLSFSGTPYAWYVEMYIGLFLLSPILGATYQSLNENGRRRLIITLLVLTVLPSFANVYRFGDIEWWIDPSANSDYFKIVPSWWERLYPITYYFLGCRIKEKKIRIGIWTNGIVVILLTVLFGLYNWWRSYGALFIWGPWQEWGAWPNLILGFFVFSFLLKLREIENLHVKKMLHILANAVFGAYLISYIPESVIYKYVIDNSLDVMNRIHWFPLVIVVYILSIILSLGLNGVYRLMKSGYQRIKEAVNEIIKCCCSLL